LSRRVWNISRQAESTTSLGSLFQGSVTLRGKKFFLMFFLSEQKKNNKAPSFLRFEKGGSADSESYLWRQMCLQLGARIIQNSSPFILFFGGAHYTLHSRFS